MQCVVFRTAAIPKRSPARARYWVFDPKPSLRAHVRSTPSAASRAFVGTPQVHESGWEAKSLHRKNVSDLDRRPRRSTPLLGWHGQPTGPRRSPSIPQRTPSAPTARPHARLGLFASAWLAAPSHSQPRRPASRSRPPQTASGSPRCTLHQPFARCGAPQGWAGQAKRPHPPRCRLDGSRPSTALADRPLVPSAGTRRWRHTRRG